MAISYEWTPQEQREYSLAKLICYLKGYVRRYHPHYRRLFGELGLDVARLSSYDEFREIPVTTAEDVAGDAEAFVMRPGGRDEAYEVDGLTPAMRMRYAARAARAGYLRDVYGAPRRFRDRVAQAVLEEWGTVSYEEGAGPGGAAFTVACTGYDMRHAFPAVAGMRYLFGWEPGMLCLNLLPCGDAPEFIRTVFAGLVVDGGACTVHACGHAAGPAGEQVMPPARLAFDLCVATPPHLSRWLEVQATAARVGGRPPSPVRYALLFGEPLEEPLRVELKRRLAEAGSPDARVIEGYGSVPLRASFCECAEGTGIHLNPEFYFWEVLDPVTREPVGWGEPGVLCFSHVGWRGTVLLRYWTGEVFPGGVVWERCAGCGLTMPVIRARSRDRAGTVEA